jgi:hypothetical protein
MRLDRASAGHDVSHASATPQAESVSNCSRNPIDATCHRRRPRTIRCFYGFAPPYCHGCGNASALAGNARRDLFMASSWQSDSGHFR